MNLSSNFEKPEEKKSEAMPGAPRWILTEVQGGLSPAWTWSRCLPDGSVENTSRIFRGYGEAIVDAITNGFRPKDEAWIVVNAKRVRSFYNGKPAESSLPGNSKIARAQTRRK